MIELLFFSAKSCGVCVALKPKLLEAIDKRFPNVVMKVIDAEDEPVIVGQSMVFRLPAVIINAKGKEIARFAGSFGVNEVLDRIDRLTFELLEK
ncbi:MAG: thioredoxin family protein [Crocinitomicaceae bacterium]